MHASFLYLQRQADHRDAKSTTTEEMSDLLYKTAMKFHSKTGSWPYIMMDNNAIQAEIDISCLSTNHCQDGPFRDIPNRSGSPPTALTATELLNTSLQMARAGCVGGCIANML